MMAFAFAGYLVIGVVVIAGVYYLFNNITFKETEQRYTYVKTKDENGNIVEKVVDHADKQ